MACRCIGLDMAGTIFKLHVYSCVFCGIFHPPYMFIWHEILGKGFFLLRLQPGKVRLIVCIYASHQLDVWTVLICQIAVPCLPEITVSPGPLFFARRNVVICHMEKTCIQVFIIISDKIIIRVGSHIGGRHLDVAVAGDVDTF